MKSPLVAAVALAVLAPVGAVGAMVTRSPAPVDGMRTVKMTIHHSRFVPGTLDAKPGERLRIVVHNGDPIDHELIVGDTGVHLRHEKGTEAVHPPRPGEVTVGAGKTEVTTWTMVAEDTLFACHLPGHFGYGMKGILRAR